LKHRKLGPKQRTDILLAERERERERERHNSDNNVTILMMILMSHSTIDIPVASVAYVMSEAVINTHRTSATMDQHSDPSVGRQKM
jgi:hypothetical protein